MTARVLRFPSSTSADDAKKIRDALREVARELQRVVAFAEPRYRDDVAKEAARIQSDVLLKLAASVRS